MPNSISARILIARKKASLTQAQLAQRLGTHRSAVAQWELGNTNPSLMHLTQIADIVGVGLDWLATGRGRARGGQTTLRSPAAVEKAHNEFEVQCLLSFRRVPSHMHAFVFQLLAELAGPG